MATFRKVALVIAAAAVALVALPQSPAKALTIPADVRYERALAQDGVVGVRAVAETDNLPAYMPRFLVEDNVMEKRGSYPSSPEVDGFVEEKRWLNDMNSAHGGDRLIGRNPPSSGSPAVKSLKGNLQKDDWTKKQKDDWTKKKDLLTKEKDRTYHAWWSEQKNPNKNYDSIDAANKAMVNAKNRLIAHLRKKPSK